MNILIRNSTSWLFLLMLILMTGCRLPWPSPGVQVPSQAAPDVRSQYQKAFVTYQNGDYVAAAKQFETLRERAASGNMARMALFGQACAQLMAAQSPEEYQTALKLWQTWLSGAPQDLDYENPAMMAPLISEKMLFSNLPQRQDDGTTAQDEKDVTQWVLIKTRQELDNLKKKLAQSEKSSSQSEKKISELEKEIAKLKEQIHALETIDQKIQEKKSAIPSAN
jgi:outer membrane protein assembly factor BamD (BamD/ComL family)